MLLNCRGILPESPKNATLNYSEELWFYYWLRKLGYDGWFSADVFTYREDGIEALRRVVQVHRTCSRIADKLIGMDIDRIIREGGHLEMQRILWDML